MAVFSMPRRMEIPLPLNGDHITESALNEMMGKRIAFAASVGGVTTGWPYVVTAWTSTYVGEDQEASITVERDDG